MSVVNIIIEDLQWLNYATETIWQEKMQHIVDQMHNCIETNLLLTNDATITVLNKNFLGKDSPTNVLSFPESNEPKNSSDPFVGDIALSFETISKEAIKFHRKFEDHCIHMFLHGILHLLGFDHQNKKKSLIMERLEIKILQIFNIKNPYIL